LIEELLTTKNTSENLPQVFKTFRQGEVLPVAKGMMKVEKEVEVKFHSFFIMQEGGQFHTCGCFSLIRSNSMLDQCGHGGKNTTAAAS
jgi:hypothetical protein